MTLGHVAEFRSGAVQAEKSRRIIRGPRDRPSRHGRPLGGILSIFAGRDLVRHCRFAVSDANYEKRFVAGAVPNRRVNRVALLWQVADGLITLVLGLFVLAEWPVSGLWVIGLFVGIDLIFYGCAWIGLALNLRTM